MKKLFLLLTLLGITATASQAQLLKSKASPPANSAATSVQVEGVDFRTINGQLPPVVIGPRQAHRMAAYKPSGLIYGTRIYSNVWSDYSRSGLYLLDTETPAIGSIYEGTLFNTSNGVCYIDGRLWLTHKSIGIVITDDGTVSNNSISHFLFNLYTSEIEMSINPGYPSSVATAMVYDRYTGIIYGCFDDGTSHDNFFGTLDLTTGRSTVIAELDVELRGMVIDNNHRMWGIDRKTGVLYEIDMTNGILRKVGNTGVTSNYANSGCLDPITGVYYYNSCNYYESTLYAIDTETANATAVYVFPNNDEWASMWMLPQLSNAVPEAPKNVQVVFDGLEGAVSFKMPNKLANGQPEMGTQATYTIYVDGVAVVTGVANYGSNVGVPLTMEHGGQFIIAVALTNDQGESEVVRQTVTVGDAAVSAPANVTLAKSGNNFQLTWDAVAVSGVTYDVTRYPDEVQVATGLTATTFTEPVPNGFRTNYFYTITARVGNAQSHVARSNYLATGSFGLPYSNHFETQDRAAELTFINANNDAYFWKYAVNCDLHGNQGIYVPMNGRSVSFWEEMQGIVPETDDWAVTPGLPFEAGKIYTVTFKLFSLYNTTEYLERYEVKMGTSPTVAAMTQVLKSPTNILTGNLNPREDQIVFAVPADGVYYIGLHGISQGGYWFGCLGIDVSEGYDSSAPYFPMDLTAIPNADGDLTADVAVSPSGWNVQRRDLEGGYDRMELYANGKLVHTWPSPVARSTITATVTLPRDGSYNFEAVPYGISGTRGISRKVTAYVGVRPPADIASANITTTDNPGEVNMTWTPITKNADGATINSAQVTYNVYNANEQLLGEDVADPQLTFQAIDYDNDPQQFVRYYVTGHFHDYFSGKAAYTPYLLIGKPYELPFHETAPTGIMRYAWLMSGDLGWNVGAEDEDIPAQDGDGTYYYLFGSTENQTGTMTSGRIHISGSDPKLSLDYATLQGCTNTLTVKVLCNGVTTTLGTITLNGTSNDFVWKSAEWDLSAYADMDIQLEITGTVASHAAVIIDNIQVTSTGGLVGDVNGDGNIDVEDVNALINVILEIIPASSLSGKADVNGDGTTDIEDVNTLNNLILTQ